MSSLFGWDRYDQPIAATSPPATNNRATIFALHPGTKTVSSFSADSTRLISSFRHFLTPL